MPKPRVPTELTRGPFRGSGAIARGVITRGELSSRAWWHPFRDIYVWIGIADTVAVRAAAVALMLPPGAVLSGRTAAWLLGAAIDPGQSVEGTVHPASGARSRAGLVIRRALVPATDRCTVRGVPVTTALRTAIDIARWYPSVDAVIYVESLLQAHVIQLRDLAVVRVAGRGAATIRRVFSLVNIYSESPMETRLRLLLVEAGLACPVVQFSVCDDSGRFIARVDLSYPDLLIAIEYDGDHHRDRDTFARDTQRQNELVGLGWTVLRFTARDVYRRREWVVQMVRDAVAAAS